MFVLFAALRSHCVPGDQSCVTVWRTYFLGCEIYMHEVRKITQARLILSPDYVTVLRHASARLREMLQRVRRLESSGQTMLRVAQQQCEASVKTQSFVLSCVMEGQDAFITSWQFPYWSADFGHGGPVRYRIQCILVPHSCNFCGTIIKTLY